jgi:hypothetical protein
MKSMSFAKRLLSLACVTVATSLVSVCRLAFFGSWKDVGEHRSDQVVTREAGLTLELVRIQTTVVLSHSVSSFLSSSGTGSRYHYQWL